MKKTFAKTILAAYAYLSKTVSQIDKLVYRRALYSHAADYYGFCNADRQIVYIVGLINKKNKLINLKLLTDEVFVNMTSENRTLLFDRYVLRLNSVKSAKKLNVSSRTYYRKLDKAEVTFAKECLLRGIDDKVFCQDYLDQSWLKNLYDKIEDREGKSQQD